MGPLTGIFSSSVDVDNEPLLIRQENGLYVVHEETSGADRKGDNAVSYLKADYEEKYGDTPPRTFEEYKNEHDGIPSQIEQLLAEAVDIHDNSPDVTGALEWNKEANGIYSKGFFFGWQDKMNHLEGLLTEASLPQDVHLQMNEKLEQTQELAEKYELMEMRIAEVNQDLNDKGVGLKPPQPQ